MFEGIVVIVVAMLLARAWSPRFSQPWTWPKGHYICFNTKTAAQGASNDHWADNSEGWSWGNDSGLCINPATGLPMTSDSPIGFDTQGNLYGFSNPLPETTPAIEPSIFSDDTEPSWKSCSETNPATGLPMVSGTTVGYDVGGSLYGFGD